MTPTKQPPGLSARFTVVADAWFSRGLLPYYKDILSKQRKVGLITVYDELADKLRAAFDIEKVVLHQVPIQAVFVPTRDRRDTKHFPDAMNRILSELEPEPGMLYIVAAGLLGKLYCTEIKQRGGIAIDVGSIAEVWMGIQARGLDKAFVSRWKL